MIQYLTEFECEGCGKRLTLTGVACRPLGWMVVRELYGRGDLSEFCFCSSGCLTKFVASSERPEGQKPGENITFVPGHFARYPGEQLEEIVVQGFAPFPVDSQQESTLVGR